jgi:hypothetical protein
VSSKSSLIHSANDAVLDATEKYDCDAERLRNSERFSRSITPRGRRQVRRRKLQKTSTFDSNASKVTYPSLPELPSSSIPLGTVLARIGRR